MTGINCDVEGFPELKESKDNTSLKLDTQTGGETGDGLMGRTKDSIQMNQVKSETEAGRISTDTRKMPKTKGKP